MVTKTIKVVFCLLASSASLYAARNANRFDSLVASDVLTAEQVVQKSVKADQPADLSEHPSKTISSNFIQSLLFKMSKSGANIVIIGATINGTIDPESFFSDSGSPKIVPSAITFRDCVFNNLVSFRGVQFARGLDLANSQFNGGLDLSDISVQGSVNAFGISVADPKKKIILAGAHISGDLLIGVPSALIIDATGVTAKTISLTLPPEGLDDVLFAGASAANSLVIESSRLAGNSPNTNSFIRKKLDLSSVRVGSFKISVPSCAKKVKNEEFLCWPAELFASGFTFREIVVEKHAEKTQESRDPFDLNLEFLNRANSSESAFTAYEQILRTAGQVTEADRVYVDMHRKLRSDVWESSNGLAMHLKAAVYNALDFSQNLFLGYGRSAIPPLLWSIILIALGTYMFRDQDRMEKCEDEKSPSPSPTFSGFWYSLELFLPVVDLGLAKKWRPSPAYRRTLNYWRAHQLAGWILIPVALAAITGALK